MSQIYAIELNKNVPLKHYRFLLSKIDKEKQMRIERYIFHEDAWRSLVADILIRYIIVTTYNIPNHQIKFETNPYGKPFVKDLQMFHYNLSHSGKWVVCATDNKPIGIDVERVLPIDLALNPQLFSRTEILDLENKNEEDKLGYFYDLWSLKESYIKMVGRGLSIPLDTFTCRIVNNQFLFHSPVEKESVYFNQYDIDSDYRLSVCQQNPRFLEYVHPIQLETLIHKIENCNLLE